MSVLLDVKNLSTRFFLKNNVIDAVDDVSFSLRPGETLAIVGESGCGKSMTAYSVMRLVPQPGRIVSGTIRFAEHDLLALSEEEMQGIRGNLISMIFQEPMTALNPVFKVGDQIMEGARRHRGLSHAAARDLALRLLEQVGIPSPVERLSAYPHQLSGGMRQRIMIAMALALQPRLLIADEPTTALDVTIQAQILQLLDRLKLETNMALILITHDLGIVAERSETTAVMYAGRFVEQASTPELMVQPLHPYTEGLLRSLPEKARPGARLATIAGSVPPLTSILPGCGFCDRCPDKSWRCKEQAPPMIEVRKGHFVRCWKHA